MFSLVLEQYNDINKDLNILSYSIALEAENNDINTTNIDDSVNKANIGERIFNRVKDIVEKIIALIDRYLYQIKNLLKKILLSDKGFKDDLKKAEVDRRPLNGIKIITYTYAPQILDNTHNRFKKIILELISNIKLKVIDDEDSPLLLPKSEFDSYVFKQLNAPSNIDDMNVYFKFLREKFRGTKAEKTIMSGSIPTYKKNAEDYKNIQTELERDLSFFKTKIIDINANLKLASKSQNVTDEEKRKIVTKMSNLAHIYNMYFSFSNIVLELQIEMILHSRVILKKFYQL